MRCTICDKSDTGESLYDHTETVRPLTFYEDSHRLGWVCSECMDEIRDQSNDFEQADLDEELDEFERELRGE